MKAAQLDEYGALDNIQIKDVEIPTCGDGQILVGVQAASLNPFDTAIRKGDYKDSIPLKLPVTLGGDLAGTVIKVGKDVDKFKVGDEVYGQASAVAKNSGAFAEYTATKAEQISLKPGNLDYLQAAAMPLVGVSAVQALVEHLNLQADQRIFIHGGSGGIGTIAIQIAKHLGAYVAASARGQSTEYIRDLGADETIDTESEDFSEVLKNFDAVFDTVGGEDFAKCLAILKQDGVAVSMVPTVDTSKADEHDVTAITQFTKVNTDKLVTLRDLIEAGVVRPQVDKVFSLEEVRRAFEYRENNHPKGKVVLQI